MYFAKTSAMKHKQKITALLIGSLLSLHLLGSGKTTISSDTSITAFEKQSLSFMREEEKLAYDVYTLMYSKWSLMPFQNISNSESNHMAAVKTLLDRYELKDPAQTSGVFVNTTLQQLYQTLITQGNSGEIEALQVGAAIEEIDIRDLKEQLLQIKKEDIRIVYGNLMRGSRNHLRAFVSNLSMRGITYKPQYLGQQEFDEIINSPKERGGMNGGRNNQNQ